jgi:demethylmenaquinone methyltransferase/2-methoxy-6-polyprenyl-1,4-benzoquinol methylase
MTTTVDKSEDRVRRMFGEISGRYDLLNHLLSGGVDIYWRARAVRQCPPEGTAPILDVCTGTGDLALAYWKAGRGQIEVIGADFTPEMLRIAERKRDAWLKGRGDAETWRRGETNLAASPPLRVPASLSFVEADTQQLPFDGNRFQIVSVAFGLRNVTDTRRGLREMIRVCQPSGRVCILEFSLPTNAVLRGLYLFYFRTVLPRIGQLVARNRQSAYNYLPASVAEFPYGRALANILEECGLRDVTWTPLTFGIATLYIGRKPEACG